MRLTIVRHAHAGDKGTWSGDDLQRPLDERGEQQVAALVPLLNRHRVSRIVSSPALRCVQTVQALADTTGLPIEIWSDLGPEGPASSLIVASFGDRTFDDAVVCTHGEMLQQLLALEDIRRVARRSHLSRRRLLIKGSAWRLHITDDGRVTKLVHQLPPSTI